MTRLKKECGFDIWYLLYADDLVFIAHHSEINKLIKALKKVMLNFNLILNPKKRPHTVNLDDEDDEVDNERLSLNHPDFKKLVKDFTSLKTQVVRRWSIDLLVSA